MFYFRFLMELVNHCVVPRIKLYFIFSSAIDNEGSIFVSPFRLFTSGSRSV